MGVTDMMGTPHVWQKYLLHDCPFGRTDALISFSANSVVDGPSS